LNFHPHRPAWLRRFIGWIPAVSLMVAIFIISGRDAPEFMRHKLFDFQDKAAHALAYYVLAVSFLRALLWHTGASIHRKILFLAVVLSALYGLTDEWHQSFIPSRTASVDDWLADAAGALLLLFSHSWIARLLEWERNLWRFAASFRSP